MFRKTMESGYDFWSYVLIISLIITIIGILFVYIDVFPIEFNSIGIFCMYVGIFATAILLIRLMIIKLK